MAFSSKLWRHTFPYLYGLERTEVQLYHFLQCDFFPRTQKKGLMAYSTYIQLLQFTLKILLIYSCDFHQPAVLVQRDLTRSSVGIVRRNNCFKRSTPCLPFALAALILRHIPWSPLHANRLFILRKLKAILKEKHLSNWDCVVLSKWEFFIKMRAALLAPILPWVMKEGESK